MPLPLNTEEYDQDVINYLMSRNGYLVHPSEIDQGVQGNGNSVKAIVDAVGTTKNAIILLQHFPDEGDTTTYTLNTNEAIPSNIICIVQHGAILDGAGTLTLDNPSQLIAAPYQCFGSSITVLFTNAGTVWADYWASTKNAAALTAVYAAVAEGSTIKMSGGTWAFGASQFKSTANDVHIEGVGYAQASGKGTTITYTGTDAALWINRLSTLSKVRISGGAHGLKLGDPGDEGAFTGAIRDVYISGGTTAGILAQGIQLGYLENVHTQDNTGAGMLVPVGAVNTHGTFVKCVFKSNDEEGILYNANAAFKYYGCIIEANGYEGVTNATAALTDTVFDGCFIENNQADGGRTDGYYNMLLNNTGNVVHLVRCTFRAFAANAWNGTTGLKHVSFAGTLIVTENTYLGTAPFVDYNAVNAKLINRDNALAIGNVGFSSGNNYYLNATGTEQTVSYTEADSPVSLPRFSGGVTVNNAGAGGAVILTSPPVSAGQRVRIQVAAAQVVTISPNASDQIIPLTLAVNQDIENYGGIGDTIELVGVDAVYWQVTSQIGPWNNTSTASTSQTVSHTTILTTAQINNLRATPIEVVPQQLSGSVIEFVSAFLHYNFKTTAFTIGDGDELVIQYGDGADVTDGIATAGLLDQGEDEARMVLSAWAAADDIWSERNDELVIFNTGVGELSDGGTSTLTVSVTYRVHSMEP